MKPEYQAIIDEHGIWTTGFGVSDPSRRPWDALRKRHIDLCVEYLRELPEKRLDRESRGIQRGIQRRYGEGVCHGAVLVAAIYLGIPLRRSRRRVLVMYRGPEQLA